MGESNVIEPGGQQSLTEAETKQAPPFLETLLKSEGEKRYLASLFLVPSSLPPGPPLCQTQLTERLKHNESAPCDTKPSSRQARVRLEGKRNQELPSVLEKLSHLCTKRHG